MDPVLANPNGSPSRRPATSRGRTKPPAAGDRRISTCGICQLGVYDSDARAWGNGIGAPVGWNHSGRGQQGRSDTDE